MPRFQKSGQQRVSRFAHAGPLGSTAPEDVQQPSSERIPVAREVPKSANNGAFVCLPLLLVPVHRGGGACDEVLRSRVHLVPHRQRVRYESVEL